MNFTFYGRHEIAFFYSYWPEEILESCEKLKGTVAKSYFGIPEEWLGDLPSSPGTFPKVDSFVQNLNEYIRDERRKLDLISDLLRCYKIRKDDSDGNDRKKDCCMRVGGSFLNSYFIDIDRDYDDYQKQRGREVWGISQNHDLETNIMYNLIHTASDRPFRPRPSGYIF